MGCRVALYNLLIMPTFQRSILWQPDDLPGSDHCTLWQNDEGWQLDGLALLAEDNRPHLVQYRVQCNHNWETRFVLASVAVGAQERVVHFRIDDDQRWWTGKTERTTLRGCYDVDLGVTPATNTLPIRRFNLAVGESQEFLAVWVSFPGLSIDALPQRYTRLDEFLYQFENLRSGFTAKLTVDEFGLVTHYPAAWRSVVATETDDL